ncbi:PQQ-binding-like beta-propeller repeat protein [Microtetraspora sp. NBRC 13810]|uniref:outer membrane protein assembly factor BamB family protein n=1 Tax=Microtetraspora sp. NBRC 13810 TaxID=3030990 RepID=UPI00255343AA|nr:PQQ-binding-like beta-propeller repeat protein [Microtetraspora sp. NBRC 13810]
MLFVALGLVVLLAVGAGTAWFVAGTGPDAGTGAPAAEAASATWAVPLTNAGSSDFTTGLAYAGWQTGTTFVRVQKDGLLAYDLKTGKRAWGTPSPGEQLCGATPDPSGGRGAVAYGSATLCDRLAGVDAATGRITWKVRIPAEKSRLATSLIAPQIMGADGMAVLHVEDALYGYRLSDGARAWTVRAPDGCRIRAVNGAGIRVAVITECYLDGGDSVAMLDARTGKTTWRRPLTDLGLSAVVLSVDPLVIKLDDQGDKNFFTAFDSRGGKLGDFSTGKIDLLPMNRVAFIDGLTEQYRVTVHGDRLYLATFPENVPGLARSRNRAIAVDLRTGKQVWESSGTRDTMLTYVRADERGLLALEAGDRRDLSPRLVRLDAATGKAAGVAELPQAYGTDGERARVLERDGALIIMPWTSVATDFAVIHVPTGTG